MRLRLLAWALLAVSSYWAARLAWADHLSRSGRLADRERAVELAPAVPYLYDRLADRREEARLDPLPALRRAAELDPETPARWERIGQQAELANDLTAAERALLTAAARSRLYEPRYLLAQYYFRRGAGAAFWRWSREAFLLAPGDIAPLLDLCWRARPDPEWLTREIIPQRQEIRRQWARFLLGRVDEKLEANEARAAQDIWSLLARERLLPGSPGAGFDWRVPPNRGVVVTANGDSLRLSFSGKQPERCLLAWRYAPAKRGARYHVKCLGGAAGLEWQVEPSPGGELVKIRLIYQRPAGSARLEGVATLSGCRMEPTP